MIDLLLLTQNRLGATARCLRSLAPTLLRDDVRWYIVDNGSRDGTAQWLLKVASHWPEKVDVTLRADNTGVAGGRQLLLNKSRGDHVIILDSDVEARASDWLERLLEPLNDEAVGVAGPSGHWIVNDWTWYEPVEPGYVGQCDVVSGYCQAFRRSALDGFEMDLTFNPYWHEDSDTCLWLASRGLQVRCTGDIGLFHIFAGSGDDGKGKAKQQYLASKWRSKRLIREERST